MYSVFRDLAFIILSVTLDDLSIDILKFIAVIAITNSHMELLYGKYNVLATGGAIGDVLFFFASGFTLFRGGKII